MISLECLTLLASFKHSQTKNSKEADATKKKTDPEHLPFLDTLFGQWEERHTGYATESEFSVGCTWCDWQMEPRCKRPSQVGRLWGKTLIFLFSLFSRLMERFHALFLSLFLLFFKVFLESSDIAVVRVRLDQEFIRISPKHPRHRGRDLAQSHHIRTEYA